MTAKTLDVGRGETITLPPGATLTTLGPDTYQIGWQSAGETRRFTATFTREGRAVTQWFRRAESWPLLLNALRTADNIPHIYIGGVATGEDAYSLAMLLEAHGVAAHITASDLNAELIDIAEAGRYTRDSVQQATAAGVLTPATVTSFLRPEGDMFTVTDRIRERVAFEVADLRTAHIPASNVILLRNVWRHLGIPGAGHLAREVSRALPQLGILSIGGADGLADIEASDELDVVLRAASMRPLGVHDLYFRT